MSLKPIEVLMGPSGVNPYKTLMIMEELKIPYNIQYHEFQKFKEPPFVNYNPNGRAPVIDDPNTGIVLWETGAIAEYLIEQYDKEKTLTYDTFKERQLLKQWLMFQVSGQGPYMGQMSWFNNLHFEKLPSAIVRYNDEAKRIYGVLDRALQGREWLVGDKMTYVDLMFLPYNWMYNKLSGNWDKTDQDMFEAFPNVLAWHNRMAKRETWQKLMLLRDELMTREGIGKMGVPEGFSSYAEFMESLGQGQKTG